jgi:segregation and condensation protein A
MLVAFKDVLSRAEMFSHHHVNRERLSVRQRMSDILSMLREAAFQNFTQLFRPEEGRMGVTVTFVAMLELMREGLIEIVQGEAYGQIHVRTASAARHLRVVEGGAADETGDADAENEAALAQPAQPDEDAEPEADAEVGPVSTNEDSMTSAVSQSDNPDPEASK